MLSLWTCAMALRLLFMWTCTHLLLPVALIYRAWHLAGALLASCALIILALFRAR